MYGRESRYWRGRAIQVLSVVDAYTRECLALEGDTSFASRRVTRVLDGIVAERGQPGSIRCDNGPEFTSRHFLAWGVEQKSEGVHIQPGKPTQNGPCIGDTFLLKREGEMRSSE